MRLTRLELSGFKSFADTIELPFDDGITCVVGPNGCGKSNVSDAVRWVLGEQRARMLRGAKMEEVIFQGSAKRKPLNVAEVSLYFDNSDETLPISYKEVVITRRLARSGVSEYLLNQTPTRLKDIQDLLRGTGLGSEAGVVIEAQMIDRLLSDKTDERRSLFEEAAGIGLYRDRKIITERRLQQTLDDLQRLDDIVAEVHTQVRSLARQRGKAERHQQFTDKRFGIVMELARREVTALEASTREFNERRTEIETSLPTERDALTEKERQRERLAHERSGAEAQRTEVERKLADARVEIERIEGDLNLADERLQNANARKERAGDERGQAEHTASQANLEREAAADELKSARSARESVQIELDLRQSTEDEIRERLAAQRTKVRRLEDALHNEAQSLRGLTGEQSALSAELEDLSTQAAGATERLREAETAVEGTKHRLNQASSEASAAEAASATADAAVEDARTALAAAREHEAQLVVERRQAEESLSQLTARRDTLEALERDRAGLAPGARVLLEHKDRFGDGTVLGPLSDYIETTSEGAGVTERVLSEWLHAVVVQDESAIERIRDWHVETQPGPLLLLPLVPGPAGSSPVASLEPGVNAAEPARAWAQALLTGHHALDDDGHAIRRANGAIFLAGAEDSAGPLQRRAELERVQEEGRVAAAIVSDLEVAVTAAAQSHREADQALDTATEAAEAARQRAREYRAAADDLGRELERGTRDLSLIREARDRINERIHDRETRAEDVAERLRLATSTRAQLEAELETDRGSLATIESEQEAARERRVHWQVEEAQVAARETAATERVERAVSALTAAHNTMERLDTELREIDSSTGALTEQRAKWTDVIAERRVEAAELETAANTAGESVRKAEEALAACEHDVETTRRAVDALSEDLHHLELRQTEAAGRRDALRERVEAEWHRPFDEVIHATEAIEGDTTALTKEAEQLREQLERLGPVNPLAAQEYEEEKTRLDFLQTQREDLTEARASLQDSLREIDDTARAMFMETFAAIQDNFSDVFLTLFEGGECGLGLADPSDPLSSEIEIRAAPRGKRTQRIHLLSSGERALVAVSLLFAIYLAKPSPFCLLDEVDAPLDDANVQRFIRLLTEFKGETQFIVITHNPRTMQTADAVYGVTMQEPGVSTIVGVRLHEHAHV